MDDKKRWIRNTLVKRMDKHIDDIPDDPAIWQWWISIFDLFESDDYRQRREISPLSLPFYPDDPPGLDVIRCFLACHEWGVYPPGWVMDDLYGRFSRYYTDNEKGRASAEIALYFDQNNRRGQFRNMKRKPILEQACRNVAMFNQWFGVGLTTCYEIVGGRLEGLRESGGGGLNHLPTKRNLEDTFPSQKEGLLKIFGDYPPSDKDRLFVLELHEDYLAPVPRLVNELRTLRRVVGKPPKD